MLAGAATKQQVQKCHRPCLTVWMFYDFPWGALCARVALQTWSAHVRKVL